MKRNVATNNDDSHISEKRTRPGGDTTTTTTTNNGATVTHHHRSSLSHMDERNRSGEMNDVSRTGPHVAVVPSGVVVPQQYQVHQSNHHDYPNDDIMAHHHFHHPYYHHHQQESHPFPAEVLPEEDTSNHNPYRPQPQFLVPASIHDDDHENNHKNNVYSEFNPNSHTFNYSMDSNSNDKGDHANNSRCHNEHKDDNDVKILTTSGITANDDHNNNGADENIQENEKSIENCDDDDTNDNNNIDRATSQDYYFDSYAHHAIHEEMLKDEVRTKTYEMAICQNKHLFQDKIVLDVGCGTGILSMFAARAGAKHIYAVDCSSIIVQAQKIININGLSDKITLIRGKVEDIDLPVDTVDIIISEWMGYFLLYESMLDTVLFARDKWLVKNDGIIFPDKAVMYITAIEDGNVRRDRFDYWDDVYGFDMSPIKEIALREPVVDVVDAKALVTDGVPILSLDILTCTKEDLDFTSSFKLQALRNDYIHGLVAYFECAFTQIHKPIGFSTSPMARYTHWKQTILYLPDPLTVCAGEVLMGEISCQPNERNRRDLDIGLTLTFKGRYSECDNKKIPYRLR